MQAEAHGGGDRPIGNRHGTGRAAQQDRLRQGAMQSHLVALDHATTAPPAKLKNVRKKLEAAKAMDRPNTIWMSRRKPPLVSPNASESPVAMMMITATIFA